MKAIRIKTTVVVEQVVLFNQDHYPGMTLEEALQSERNNDDLESFIEGIQFTKFSPNLADPEPGRQVGMHTIEAWSVDL